MIKGSTDAALYPIHKLYEQARKLFLYALFLDSVVFPCRFSPLGFVSYAPPTFNRPCGDIVCPVIADGECLLANSETMFDCPQRALYNVASKGDLNSNRLISIVSICFRKYLSGNTIDLHCKDTGVLMAAGTEGFASAICFVWIGTTRTVRGVADKGVNTLELLRFG